MGTDRDIFKIWLSPGVLRQKFPPRGFGGKAQIGDLEPEVEAQCLTCVGL